ncbi:hypothetical protein BD626DRAFT_212778 [Schizophyllum amplum]|uniref:Uncharacterized protein n=1 Tax=Schizophyllum amplum TaxID=97359 RepID=A0A550BXX3_9AGAR|nr:hypothetical protein BD626DRAFT_212778 [Auriculariopsis ampla]
MWHKAELMIVGIDHVQYRSFNLPPSRARLEPPPSIVGSGTCWQGAIVVDPAFLSRCSSQSSFAFRSCFTPVRSFKLSDARRPHCQLMANAFRSQSRFRKLFRGLIFPEDDWRCGTGLLRVSATRFSDVNRRRDRRRFHSPRWPVYQVTTARASVLIFRESLMSVGRLFEVS